MENQMLITMTSARACATSVRAAVSATSAVRGIAARAAVTTTWDDAITGGKKRTGFAPAHVPGPSAWSPPL